MPKKKKGQHEEKNAPKEGEREREREEMTYMSAVSGKFTFAGRSCHSVVGLVWFGFGEVFFSVCI